MTKEQCFLHDLSKRISRLYAKDMASRPDTVCSGEYEITIIHDPDGHSLEICVPVSEGKDDTEET